ncbi:MAG TPA: YaiI/YqxD family protein [Clostridiaceae bacterium]|nr:YaiI/YqxD family protein [Clostridiaceae bacterium]
MKILVDADACPVPVKNTIIKVAKEFGLPVIMIIDTSHIIDDGYSEVITVDKQENSADLAIINRTLPGDVVVTQDFGLAAMAIGKGAAAINQNGMIYSSENIDRLLFERHISQKVRCSGKRIAGPKKRLKDNDIKFEASFRALIHRLYMSIYG